MLNVPSEIDVLVVGAGLAGYCAAYEASLHGASVLICEKLAQAGGSTALSSGFFAFSGTDLQHNQGIVDNGDMLLRDLIIAGGGLSDPSILQVYVDQQLATSDWLKTLGMTFKAVQLSSAQSVPRTHPLPIQMLMDTLHSKLVNELGVQLLYQTSVCQLLPDNNTGYINGVRCQYLNEQFTIKVSKGVILATGGFSRSEAMLKQYAPSQAEGVRYGGQGNTGDGIHMGLALGAELKDMHVVKGTFGFHPKAATDPGENWTKLPVYRGGIAVNKLGQRFMDESQSYKLLGDCTLQQPGAIAYQVFDQAIMDDAPDGVPPFDFRSAHRRGLMLYGNTIAELAVAIGCDPIELESTVNRYNQAIVQGIEPEFNRSSLSAGFGICPTLAQPPYYAYPSASGIIATYCGLAIDTQARVLHTNGHAFENLFAVGEVMGGFHGNSYMTGTALGKCVIFGRIAGQTVSRL
jgi:fumarate reductase flavoprotein subunit